MYGYAGRILRVDLSKKEVLYEDLEKKIIEKFLGGTGFSTKILYDELQPEIHPLGPKNKIVFAVGPLTGTLAPGGGSRYIVAAKSPLTGIWGEGDAGGFFGAELKFSGFDVVIVKGASEKPALLWISDGKAEILEAKDLWGMGTYETKKTIQNDLGSKVKVASIGPAGEKLVKIAIIVNDLGRAAARSGLGAVMGSKKLKAIAVKGENKVEVANMDKLKEIRKRMTEELRSSSGAQNLSKYGTGGESCEFFLKIRNLPLKNWMQNDWDLESAKKLGGKRIAETIRIKSQACYGCPIGCVHIVQVQSGPFAMEEEDRRPEYETLASLGSLCLCDNLEAIAKANYLCNKYGIDTIHAGTLIAFAMECYEKRIISKKDVGMELGWGDAEAIVKLVGMIAQREGFGDVLAEGVKLAAEKIGRGALNYAMHVKGSPICMHDPRAAPRMALNYATGNLGAYHGKGQKFSSAITSQSTVNELIIKQNWAEVVDSLVMCDFMFAVWGGGLTIDLYIPQLISAVSGINYDVKELLKIGERIYNMKRLHNLKMGISKKDDVLPKRFMKIPRTTESGEKLITNLEPMLAEYYRIRGWNKNGIPTEGKLKKLAII